jgi:hypothetical protein
MRDQGGITPLKWFEILLIAVLIPSAGYLFVELAQLGNRISKLEGSFQTFMELRSQLQTLRQDVGTIQSDISDLRAQKILITRVPVAGAGPDSQGIIGGKVEGIKDPNAYKVVLYVRTDKWYVQPHTAQPFTPVESDGSWSASIHLGSEYVALLVRPSFQPPAQSDSLPAFGKDVLSVARAAARKTE